MNASKPAIWTPGDWNALIADPDLVRRMAGDAGARSRCNQCNVCVAEMDIGGVRCVLDDGVAA